MCSRFRGDGGVSVPGVELVAAEAEGVVAVVALLRHVLRRSLNGGAVLLPRCDGTANASMDIVARVVVRDHVGALNVVSGERDGARERGYAHDNRNQAHLVRRGCDTIWVKQLF